MPINQDRMITMISIAQTAFNALDLGIETAKQQIAIISSKLDSHTPSHEIKYMLQTLEILLEPETLINQAGPNPYIDCKMTIATEERHFREFKAANSRNKRYQANKRHRDRHMRQAFIPETALQRNVPQAPLQAPSAKPQTQLNRDLAQQEEEEFYTGYDEDPLG